MGSIGHDPAHAGSPDQLIRAQTVQQSYHDASSHVIPGHRTERVSAKLKGWQLENACYLDQRISMLQGSLLSVHLVVAKGPGHQEDWSPPPRKDPEQKFRRLGGKHSGGNYTYKRHSWWSGEQTCLPL